MKMTEEAQRSAIAEACGWTEIGDCTCGLHPRGVPPGGAANSQRIHIPDYLNDLNACHEMEITLEDDPNLDALYWTNLYKVLDGEFENGEPCDGPPNGHWCDLKKVGHATAAQRSEAFLRTTGRYEE